MNAFPFAVDVARLADQLRWLHSDQLGIRFIHHYIDPVLISHGYGVLGSRKNRFHHALHFFQTIDFRGKFLQLGHFFKNRHCANDFPIFIPDGHSAGNQGCLFIDLNDMVNFCDGVLDDFRHSGNRRDFRNMAADRISFHMKDAPGSIIEKNHLSIPVCGGDSIVGGV